MFDDDDDLFEVANRLRKNLSQALSEPEPLDLGLLTLKIGAIFYVRSMTPTEKKYDIVNNDLTDALTLNILRWKNGQEKKEWWFVKKSKKKARCGL